MIKVLFLKNGTYIVSEIIELVGDIGEPDCKLVNPYEIKTDIAENVFLHFWPKYSSQKELMIHSDSILTIFDPTEEILKKYLDIIS